MVMDSFTNGRVPRLLLKVKRLLLFLFSIVLFALRANKSSEGEKVSNDGSTSGRPLGRPCTETALETFFKAPEPSSLREEGGRRVKDKIIKDIGEIKFRKKKLLKKNPYIFISD